MFLKFPKITGLEVVILSNKSITYNFSILTIKKETLSIGATNQNITSAEQLKLHLPKDTPVSLVINGRGILHKKIPADIRDDRSIVEHILPNAKAEEFYIQKQVISQGELFVSIIRKSTLDEILKLFTENSFPVISVSLGPFCLQSIIPLISSSGLATKESVNVSHYQLSYKAGLLDSFSQVNSERVSEKSIAIGTQQVPESALIALAGGFQEIFPQYGQVTLTAEPVQKIREEWEQKKIFKFSGYAVLGCFLSILLINALLFNNLYSETQTISASIGSGKETLQRLDSLKSMVEEKEKFLHASGWLEGSRTSWYSDQIAQSLPIEIVLTSMIINPIEESTKPDDKTLSFKDGLIRVSGVCSKSTDLNNWMRSLQQHAWTDSVNIRNYSQENAREKGSFIIEIVTK